MAFLIKDGNHIEHEPYLTAFLIANLRFDGLLDSIVSQMIHTVQRRGNSTAETWRTQSDATQLRHAHLSFIDIV